MARSNTVRDDMSKSLRRGIFEEALELLVLFELVVLFGTLVLLWEDERGIVALLGHWHLGIKDSSVRNVRTIVYLVCSPREM